MSRRLGPAAALFVVGFVALVYGCDAGRGFIKDDFGWIDTSRIEESRDFHKLAQPGTGFFRPVVTLSFAVNEALFGLSPRGYGLTNLLLLGACAGALFGLLRAMGFTRGVGFAAAAAWTLNFHGINMAVLWISGRTALWLTLFATLTAWAWVRGRPLAAGALAILAMGSKEEAFVLPAILSAWALLDRPSALGRTWPLWLAAAAALIARTASGAYTPASAPPFYQYQWELATLVRNGYQYADRSATSMAGALVLFWLAAGRPTIERPGSRGGLVKGIVWLAIAFTPTLLLPVRSSLYALFPAVGVAIAGAEVLESMLRTVGAARRTRAVAIVLAVLVALYPVYRARNRRYVREAELSTSVMREVAAIAERAEPGSLVVVRDARDVRPTAEQAFGSLADQAAKVVVGGRLRLWIDPPPGEMASAPVPNLADAAAVLEVRGGRVARVR